MAIASTTDGDGIMLKLGRLVQCEHIVCLSRYYLRITTDRNYQLFELPPINAGNSNVGNFHFLMVPYRSLHSYHLTQTLTLTLTLTHTLRPNPHPKQCPNPYPNPYPNSFPKSLTHTLKYTLTHILFHALTHTLTHTLNHTLAKTVKRDWVRERERVKKFIKSKWGREIYKEGKKII